MNKLNDGGFRPILNLKSYATKCTIVKDNLLAQHEII